MNLLSTALRGTAALLGGLTLAAAYGGPALAADAAANQFTVDSDAVTVATAGTGAVTGTMTAFHAAGNVQAQLLGVVSREAGGPPCVWAEATFQYADNATETSRTSRACAGEYPQRTVDLHSSTSRDTVRVTVVLRSAVDATSPGVGVRTAVYFVGDPPDSVGTAAQLDSDVTNVVVSGRTLFTGRSTWRIDRPYLVGYGTIGVTKARLQGTFSWHDVLPSARADVVVCWRYADGSTATSIAGRLSRGGAPIQVDTVSPSFVDVRSLVVTIQPAPSGTTTYPAAGSSGQQTFGDHYGV
jgi:hypothetical protein